MPIPPTPQQKTPSQARNFEMPQDALKDAVQTSALTGRPSTAQIPTPTSSSSTSSSMVVSSKPSRQQANNDTAELSRIEDQLQEAKEKALDIQAELKQRENRSNGSSDTLAQPQNATQSPAGGDNEGSAGNSSNTIPSPQNGNFNVFEDYQAAQISLNNQVDSALDQTLAQLSAMQVRFDRAENAMVESIKQQYEIRQQEMKESNKAHLGALQTLGVRSGRARYAPEMQTSILAEEERQGIQRLTALNAEEASLISQARQAAAAKDFQLLQTRMRAIKVARAQKSQIVQNLYESAIQFEQLAMKRSQAARQAERDAFAFATKKAKTYAGGLASTIKDLDPEQQQLVFEAAADKLGISPTILAGAVNDKLREIQLSQLDIKNQELSIADMLNPDLQFKEVGDAGYMFNPATGKLEQIFQAPEDFQFENVSGIGYVFNPETGKVEQVTKPNTPGSQISAGSEEAGGFTSVSDILGSLDLSAGTKTKIYKTLGVINAVKDLAQQNPEGEFTGVYPLRPVMNILPQFFKREETLQNEGYLNAINLRVQQWASGSALSDKQIQQVQKLVPDVNDTDAQMKTKLNNLVDFMNSQIETVFDINGVDYDIPHSDLFGTEYKSLLEQASPEQLQELSKVSANVPQRNNNPGNVKAGGIADKFALQDAQGNPVTDDQGHLVFPSAGAGFKALATDLSAKISGQSRWTEENPTLAELGDVWAEDPNWANKVAQILGTEVSTPTKQIPFDQLLEAVATQEGFYA